MRETLFPVKKKEFIDFNLKLTKKEERPDPRAIAEGPVNPLIPTLARCILLYPHKRATTRVTVAARKS
jgi:hypothetical protein